MKIFTLIILFIAQLFAINVYSQIVPSDDVIKNFEGEWVWTSSVGGFAGHTIYPDSVTKSYVFQKIENNMDSIAYTYYENTVLKMSGKAKLSYDSTAQGKEFVLEGLKGFSFFFKPVVNIQVANDGKKILSLEEKSCSDCYVYYFTRKEDKVTGVNTQVENNNIEIYPNPCQTSFALNSDKNITSVTLLNSLGQVVEQKVGNVSEVVISHLPSGQYFVNISTQDETIVRKLIIE